MQIFKKEHRSVCFMNFEGKVVLPHPVCQEEPVFEQATASLQDLPSRCPFHHC